MDSRGGLQVEVVVHSPPANADDAIDSVQLWVGKTPWERKRQPTPVFLAGKFQGQRNSRLQLMGWQRVRHK